MLSWKICFSKESQEDLQVYHIDKYDTWTMFYLHTEVFPWNWIHMLRLQHLLICNLELSEECFNYLKSSVFAIATGTLLLMHEKIQSWFNLFGLLITSELKIPPGSVRKPKQKLILTLLLILLNRKLKGKAESIIHTCKKDVLLQCLILTDMSVKRVRRGNGSRENFNWICVAANFWRFWRKAISVI